MEALFAVLAVFSVVGGLYAFGGMISAIFRGVVNLVSALSRRPAVAPVHGDAD